MSRLRKAREERGYSQYELARLSGVHRVTITKIENGHQRPHAYTLAKLADALGVTVDSILDGEE